ncbi:MAG: hypothetical protein MSC31_10875 [Solirubrobacteraceae bacterium MAG38_C4-C5]|nr:hypothetical protein [Candidatus Siliceabacter maunaloa]
MLGHERTDLGDAHRRDLLVREASLPSSLLLGVELAMNLVTSPGDAPGEGVRQRGAFSGRGQQPIPLAGSLVQVRVIAPGRRAAP